MQGRIIKNIKGKIKNNKKMEDEKQLIIKKDQRLLCIYICKSFIHNYLKYNPIKRRYLTANSLSVIFSNTTFQNFGCSLSVEAELCSEIISNSSDGLRLLRHDEQHSHLLRLESLESETLRNCS